MPNEVSEFPCPASNQTICIDSLTTVPDVAATTPRIPHSPVSPGPFPATAPRRDLRLSVTCAPSGSCSATPRAPVTCAPSARSCPPLPPPWLNGVFRFSSYTNSLACSSVNTVPAFLRKAESSHQPRGQPKKSILSLPESCNGPQIGPSYATLFLPNLELTVGYPSCHGTGRDAVWGQSVDLAPLVEIGLALVMSESPLTNV